MGPNCDSIAVLCIVGLPGSGKTTQANLLRARLGYVPLGGGAWLRKRAAEGDSQAYELLRESKPMPSDLFSVYLGESASQVLLQGSGAMVLDGSPRNVLQAEQIAGWCAETESRLGVWFLSMSPRESRVRLDDRQASAHARDESVATRIDRDHTALRGILASPPRGCDVRVSKASDPVQDVLAVGTAFLADLIRRPGLRPS